jgi:superfamily II DNA or RNA helicase
MIRSHPQAATAALLRLLDEVEATIERAERNLRGRERALVLADLETEYQEIDQALTALIGPPRSRQRSGRQPVAPDAETATPSPAGTTQLQLSWTAGRIVAWAAGHDAPSADDEQLVELLHAAGAGSIEWSPHNPVKVPGQGKAAARTAPIEGCLGWLVALGRTADDEQAGVSVTWIGRATESAVRLVAQGRMVPQMKKTRRRRSKADGPTPAKKGPDAPSGFEVRWVPALVDAEEHQELAASLPSTVGVLENRPDARSMTTAVLTDLVSAICMEAARRLDVPAAPPDPTNKSEVSEAFLAHLGGEPFDAPARMGSELARRVDQWTRSVSGIKKFKLVIQLDPPDESNAWYLAVLAPNSDNRLLPVEQVMVNSSNTRRKEVEEELVRLERLFPELLRPGARRRGEVILSQDEAWNLMSRDGAVLTAAGYEVRAPILSRKKPTPSLRLTSEADQDSVVGARQLADVRWSVVFDDIELSADEIRDLASQARPLVESKGRWVELDQADLAQAAAALADRADQTKLTGADMLRHALGLEGMPLAGGVSIAGQGWAADLLQSAASLPQDPPIELEGFVGTLRSYQADARMWLSFLDSAGLGGCLALDMGLGKTPTMLAHIQASRGKGPALVVAPPAVVGNWYSEARKFVPGLTVRVHHGPNRASASRLKAFVSGADVIITTYGTAVRDVTGLEQVEWDKVVLDEAQAIKNPASETAQQLRRLNARTRVALTGTPIENGLGDLWALLDFTNPGLIGPRASFVAQLSADNSRDPAGKSKEAAENALRALNGILVFRRTKAEPDIAAELPDRIDELDRCAMTPEQVGLYQAVLDGLLAETTDEDSSSKRKGAVLAAITALKQICNHPAAYQKDDTEPLDGRSGKLTRLNEIIDNVFAAEERILIFTHFASWGERLAEYLSARTGVGISCYHGGLSRSARDKMVSDFQKGDGAGAMVLSLKAGGTGLNLTAASHVVLYDRWWNPAVEDQARDRVWRIGQTKTVICHRLICPGTVDERVEEVVAGKRQIADMVLPKSSSVGDLDAEQLQVALGLDPNLLISDSEDRDHQADAGDSDSWPAEATEPGRETGSTSTDALVG